MKHIRIGAGAGYSGDRLQPALDLIERGNLSYSVFECLAERTIALAQKRKLANPEQGYDPMLELRIRAILSSRAEPRVRIISNMGAANPLAAARKTREIAVALGIRNLKIAAVTGDDVLSIVRERDLEVIETGERVSQLGNKLVSANAYLGATPVVDALAAGADIVLAGRIADPSLFLAPLIHEFGWDSADWKRLGCGILVGHLLECAGQLTGGYFADPGYKEVPGLATLGFPFADIDEFGNATLGKLDGTGGMLTPATCKEQLLYEVHDPTRYVTPDVVADFSKVQIEGLANDVISVAGASGTEKPPMLKVSLGCSEGFIADGQISYAGAGAQQRGELAIEVIKEQFSLQNIAIDEVRYELIGINSVVPARKSDVSCPREIRLRVAARTSDIQSAKLITETVEALYTNGPAGGGGITTAITPVMAIYSTLIPREWVAPKVHYEVTP
jgi:Acyclic terpene utilisation family protein AtuA